MKVKTRALVTIILTLLLAGSLIMGCGGGGGGTGSGTTPDGGGGGDSSTPTANFSTTNSKTVSYYCLKSLNENPMEMYDFGGQNDVARKVLEDAFRNVDLSRAETTVDQTVTDPFDQNGTMHITGTISTQAGGDKSANLTLTFTDWYMFFPYRSQSQFNANGTVTLVVEVTNNETQFSAVSTYNNLTLTSYSTPQVTITNNGTINQAGTLEDMEQASYTITVDTTKTVSGSVHEDQNGTLVNQTSATMTAYEEEMKVEMAIQGTLSFTDFDELTSTVTIATTQDVVLEYDESSQDFIIQSGQITMTNSGNDTLVVDATGNGNIEISLNGTTVYEGAYSLFMAGQY
ncbi:MAG: hypothetical protein ACLFQV_11960 [Vulcanimicrobiota bacterium]